MHRPTFTALLVGVCLTAGFALPADASPTELRAQAEESVSALLAEVPSARAHWRADLVGPSMLLGLFLEVPGASPREKAEAFLAEHADLFGLSPADLVFREESRARKRTVLTFQQVYQGQEVYKRVLKITVDGKGLVTRVINDTFPVEDLRSAQLDLAFARDLAKERTRAQRVADLERVESVVVAGPGGAFEAAVVRVAPDAKKASVLEVVVDRSRGEVAGIKQAVVR